MTRSTSKSLIRFVIGALVAGAGLAHFTHANFFSALVPDTLDAYRNDVNVATGVLQIVMGVTFWVPRLRSVARWSTIALLGLTLPAAVDQVIHPETIASVGITPAVAALRVLVQLLMIFVIWWATTPDNAGQTNA